MVLTIRVLKFWFGKFRRKMLTVFQEFDNFNDRLICYCRYSSLDEDVIFNSEGKGVRGISTVENNRERRSFREQC